ncbi:MAG: MFS transporter [Parvularculaceae bacterium]|nr:MFS transporter [Parvularculaceae bacterium]
MTEAAPDNETSIPWASLSAAIAAISVAGLGFGHSLPLFTYVLKSHGAADWVIGNNAAFGAIASLLGAPFYPRIIAKIGLKAFIVLSLLTMIIPYLFVFWAGDQLWMWYPLRFIFGAGGAGLFAASEIWINGIAPDKIRGKVIGVYGTMLALGFAAGPAILTATGYEGYLPWVVGAAVYGLAAVPLFFVRAPKAADEANDGSIFPPMLKSPVLFGAAAIFAGVESAMLIFLPILALELGYGVGIGALSVTVYGVGLLAAQIPVGQLADMFPARRVMGACAIAGAVLALFIPIVQSNLWALYAVLFVWGGAVGGIYTAGLVVIGNTFKGTALAVANTAFVFTYAAGAVLGPFSAGIDRSAAGANGLMFGLVVVLSAYAWAAWRSGRAAS